jgi:protein O-GlcNAc transferase
MTPALRSAPVLRERTRQIGRTALEQGNTTVALFLYELVLAAAPDDAEAHVGAGLVLLARNDAAGAIVHLRAAVERAPALAEAQLALAACAEQLGRTAEASAALARAEASAPDSPAIQSGAAELYARRRDFPTAIRLYRRVVELDPADSRAHAALGYLLIHAGDRAGGIAEWRRALELNPNIPGLRDRLRQEEK